MTGHLTDSAAPGSIVMLKPAPAPVWTWESLRRWLQPSVGSRANARDACLEIPSTRQRTLAWAWEIGHPSAVPPCGHVAGEHQCSACAARPAAQKREQRQAE